MHKQIFMEIIIFLELHNTNKSEVFSLRIW
jgi:hypothetical protein